MKTETLTIGGYVILAIQILLLGVLIGKAVFRPEIDPEAEKLQLEIQHLKYQVKRDSVNYGSDTLRYDLELNFYERRKAK